mgnify:CR=1 FL=1
MIETSPAEHFPTETEGLSEAERPETIELADGVGLRAIATPGHTPEHLTFLVTDGAVEPRGDDGGCAARRSGARAYRTRTR